ncbi:MAG TPA: nucleotide exchange factor GrpE [Chloroflexota bacterium]|nr:nucleotide exchange factor GrpE [Chloroflexota bacterium]
MNQEERELNQMSRGRPGGPTEASSSESGAGAVESENESDICAQLERDLDEARSKAQTYLDLAQRTQADFINYRRRVEQERGEHMRAARGETLVKVLPLLDDLDRAIASLPQNLASSDWVQGVVLIGRKLQNSLQSLGVQRVGEPGSPFDPYQEEAIMYEPSAQYPAGTVTQVIQSGYILDGRVLRPAQVIVSSGPPAQAPG